MMRTSGRAAVVLLVAVLANGCGSDESASDSNPYATTRNASGGIDPLPSDDDGPCTRAITYRVEGDVSHAQVTMTNAQGNTEQATPDVPLTMKDGTEGLLVGTFPCGDFVYLSAQSQDNLSGKITCIIEADGVAIEEATSSGKFAIASCSGTVR